MKIFTPLIVAIAVVVAVVISVSAWLVFDRGPSTASQDVQPTPQKYDTTGGQEMRPRWNSQDGGE